MLGKLFKYDQKATGRILWPFYAVIVAMGIVLGFMMKGMIASVMDPFGPDTPVTVGGPFTQVLGGLFGNVISISMVVTLIVCITRFYTTMFGKEASVYHSLPVKDEALLGSQYLNSILFLFVNMLILMGVIFFIAFLSFDSYEFRTMFTSFYENLGEYVSVTQLLFMILLFVFSIYTTITMAISISSLFKTNHIFTSCLIVFGIWWLLTPTLRLVRSDFTLDLNYSTMVLVIEIIIEFIVTYWILHKKLNIEG